MRKYEHVINNRKEFNRTAVFVVGPPRSGTSMLARIISLPENSIFLGETGIFSNCLWQTVPWTQLINKKNRTKLLGKSNRSFILAITRRSYSLLRRKDRLRTAIEKAVRFALIPKTNDLVKLRAIQNNGGKRPGKEEHRLINELCIKYHKITDKPNSLIKIFMEDMRLLGNADYVVEKTPNHLDYLNTIHYCLPSAIIAGIYRESMQDCLASYFAMTKNWHTTKQLCRKLPEMRHLVKKIAEQNSTKNFVIKYEDMISDPITITKRMYSILGLHFNDAIINSLIDIKPQPPKYNNLSPTNQRKLDKFLKEAMS